MIIEKEKMIISKNEQMKDLYSYSVILKYKESKILKIIEFEM